jgi:3-hydroxymyristoyl/3-hydroxydecanoyl-(acyl carrier protein) dehydratase
MPDQGPPALWPELLKVDLDAGEAVLALRIPEDLAYFPGHFPRIAVVPGVVQIHWAVHFAQQCLGITRRFQHMEVIKFKELLLPGQYVRLHLQFSAPANKLQFCYRSDHHEYSSGRIYFHGNDV